MVDWLFMPGPVAVPNGVLRWKPIQQRKSSLYPGEGGNLGKLRHNWGDWRNLVCGDCSHAVTSLRSRVAAASISVTSAKRYLRRRSPSFTGRNFPFFSYR